MDYVVNEQLVEFDPDVRQSWQENGTWPHSNHFHFNEAVVAAHFTLLGYHVLRDYGIKPSAKARTTHATQILHAVVGKSTSEYLTSAEFADATDGLSGLPDLFVYRALDPENDDKVRYEDENDWFFVEVKGPGDRVSDNQKKFWHAIAERCGPERIRLYRTAPVGQQPQVAEVEY